MSVFRSKNAGFPSPLPTALQLADIERSVPPLGEEYIVSDQGVTAATEVLQGRMEVFSVQDGLVVYRTEVRDLCTMRTSNLLYPGIKITLALEGGTVLFYGSLRLHLRAGAPAHPETPCGAMVALARTDRFMRQWRAGRRERKLVITLTPQWLAQAGVLHGRLAEFAGRHLARAPWQPSARALALADQVHRGCPLPSHLAPLWYAGHCTEIALEAFASVESVPTAHPGDAMPAKARLQVRLAALRDWLATPAADGLDLAAIARQAGMSAAHLQRHFPGVANGVSLGRFVRTQRLLRARAALEQGRPSVAQAAQLAGYRSRTHFAAAFRAEFGLAPSRCKK